MEFSDIFSQKKTRFNTQILLAMLVAFAVMFVLSLNAYATEDVTGGTATVKGDSVNVRKSADANSDAVGKAKKGDTFTILSSENGADGKTWYEVKNDSITGYIRSDLVDVKAAEPAENAENAELAGHTEDAEPAEHTGNPERHLAGSSPPPGKYKRSKTASAW